MHKGVYKILLLLLITVPLAVSAKDIPQELQSLGFTKYTLIDYEKQNNIEYFTFSDWRTKQSGDIITFAVIDGKVKEWFKGVENRVLGMGI